MVKKAELEGGELEVDFDPMTQSFEFERDTLLKINEIDNLRQSLLDQLVQGKEVA